MKGPANLLSPIEYVSVSTSIERAIGLGLLGRLLNCVDRGGRGHFAD